jgi:hypothetical protein
MTRVRLCDHTRDGTPYDTQRATGVPLPIRVLRSQQFEELSSSIRMNQKCPLANSGDCAMMTRQGCDGLTGEESNDGGLCLPQGSPPYPAVVFIHGSGPVRRDGLTMFPPMWEAFAQRGIGSLAWDKPGVGESSGD